MRGYPKDASGSLADNRDGDQVVKNQFSRRLYNALVAKGLTQSELARRAGLNRAAVSSYATARSLPNPANLAALAKVLDQAPEELLPPIGELTAESATHIDASSYKDVGGGNARLQINKIVPTKLALEILRMVSDGSAKIAN